MTTFVTLASAALGLAVLVLRLEPAAADPSTGQAAAAPAAATTVSGNLVGHGGPVKAIAVSPDGRHALSGSFDYAMMYWDLEAVPPKELQRFDDHDGAVNAVAFVPGGKQVLSAGDDGHIALWQIETGKLVHRFKGHTAKVVGMTVSDDGTLVATAGWDRSARLWNLATLQPGPVLEGHGGNVNAVVFGALRDRDAPVLFTAHYDGAIRAWDARSGTYLHPVYKHGWGINALKRVPGSNLLVFGSLNGGVGVVDPDAGKLVKELTPHDGPVLSLAVLEKPGLVATGGGGRKGKGGIIRIWRIGDWALLEEYTNAYGPVWALAFADRGARIYYGGLDDFVTLWQVSPRKPFEQVSGTFPRRFQVTENVSLGERQFARKCSICHTLRPDGKNRAGPTLYKLFGRRAGTLPGYPYSPALKSADIVWSEETVAELFVQGPEHYTPGTKMPLQKITDVKKRNALIAFLKAATEAQPDAAGSDRQGAARSKE